MKIQPKWFNDPSVQTIREVMGAAPYRYVGGCVRDAMMGRDVDDIETNDIDIATPILPQIISEKFEAAGYRVIPTGIEHGTVTVIINSTPFEFTTLRKDVETDGRRAVIAFTDKWEEDAQRRDFRFNALYLDAYGVVHDPTGGGVDDALKRRITFVGDADARLREDYLRILRLFRFQAQLGCTVDADALAACERQRQGIETLSGERIYKEMSKLLSQTGAFHAVFTMEQTGVLNHIVNGAVSMTMLYRTTCFSPDWQVRLAALMDWNIGAAFETAQRWKMSNADRKRVHDAMAYGVLGDDVREQIYWNGEQATWDREILTAAHEERTPRRFVLETKRDTFPIRGGDLVAMGMKGKEVSVKMKELETWWVANGFPGKDEVMANV